MKIYKISSVTRSNWWIKFFNLRIKCFETNYEMVTIYLLYCFTKLVSGNNIIENVSKSLQGSILKPKAQCRFTFCLLVQIKWQFQNLLHHFKTPIKQHKQHCNQKHQIIVLLLVFVWHGYSLSIRKSQTPSQIECHRRTNTMW